MNELGRGQAFGQPYARLVYLSPRRFCVRLRDRTCGLSDMILLRHDGSAIYKRDWMGMIKLLSL